jgi:hypothetical protein
MQWALFQVNLSLIFIDWIIGKKLAISMFIRLKTIVCPE